MQVSWKPNLAPNIKKYVQQSMLRGKHEQYITLKGKSGQKIRMKEPHFGYALDVIFK